jgi:hypothetical protein
VRRVRGVCVSAASYILQTRNATTDGRTDGRTDRLKASLIILLPAPHALEATDTKDRSYAAALFVQFP